MSSVVNLAGAEEEKNEEVHGSQGRQIDGPNRYWDAATRSTQREPQTRRQAKAQADAGKIAE
jgi:hypothetical protein